MSLRALPSSAAGVGDGGPALSATLDNPKGLAFGPDGSLYIADEYNNSIRKVAQPGTAQATITTVAGTGVLGSASGSTPTTSQLALPMGVAVNSSGGLLIADFLNHRIEFLTNPGGAGSALSTTAGTTGVCGASPNLCYPSGVTVSGNGGNQLWVADRSNFAVVTPGSAAVTSGRGFSDALTPLAAGPFGLYQRPVALAWAKGWRGPESVFVADSSNHALRHLDSFGVTQTAAGNGTLGNSGDNGPAYQAVLAQPSAVAVDNGPGTDNSTDDVAVYVSDSENNTVRKLTCANVHRCFYSDPNPASGACGLTANIPPTNDGNVCTDDACWWSTGEVTHRPSTTATFCSDGNACNGTETCSGGVCVPGTPLASGASCFDSNACNGTEICDPNHVCQPGALPAIDDSNPCTVDACSTAGGVTHVA